MRAGESQEKPYRFVKTKVISDLKNKDALATYLFTNEESWKRGARKYLYALSKDEVLGHLGRNLVYNVNEPRYIRELQEFFERNGIDGYEFKVIRFAQNKNNKPMLERGNIHARIFHTASDKDFEHAQLPVPDWDVVGSAARTNYPAEMVEWFNQVAVQAYAGKNKGPAPKFDLQGLVFDANLNSWKR
jgi:hypothetical protein